jgi:hypothetical protein
MNEKERISILEESSRDLKERVNLVDQKVDKVITNHLPHIQEALNTMELKNIERHNELSLKLTKIATIGSVILVAIQILIPIISPIISKYL